MTWPVADNFTNSNGTALPTHSAAWVEHGSWALGAARIYNNRLSNDGGGTSVYYYNDAPSGADYEVQATVYQVDTNTAQNAGVVGRCSTSQSTFYMARYRYGTGVQLFKFVNSTTGTQLGSTVTGDLANGATTVLKLSMVGTAIKVYRDGAEIISVTDADISAAGYPGVWLSCTDTTGSHLDTWSGTIASSGSAIAAISNFHRMLRSA